MRIWVVSACQSPAGWAVNAEINLSALAYNLKRAMKVLGVSKLLAHLDSATAKAAH
jgi:hypothetical protein